MAVIPDKFLDLFKKKAFAHLAPAAVEMLSFIKVPPKSFAPASLTWPR
ncbi:MAG: hypothetical protein M1482_11950 [Chloroflexi bacterium]|nr:hypothetical protein [Chloroflexota bacterium]